MKNILRINILIIIITLSFNGESKASDKKINFESDPDSKMLGRLCYKNGSTKKIKAKDAIWLAKMIHGETGGNPTQEDADAMLWSIAQRTNLGIWKKKSIEKLARAYSQPINEKWTKNGKKCKKYHKANYKGKVRSNCSLKLVKRRAKFIDMSWKDIDPLAREAVLNFANGKIKNPVVGSVGWFAPKVWEGREKKGRNKARKANKAKGVKARTSMIFHEDIDGNIYFYRGNGPNTRKWDIDEVRVVGPGKKCR